MRRCALVRRFPVFFCVRRNCPFEVLQVHRAPNIGGYWNLSCRRALSIFQHHTHPVQKAGNAWSSRTQLTTIPSRPPFTTLLFEHLPRPLLLEHRRNDRAGFAHNHAEFCLYSKKVCGKQSKGGTAAARHLYLFLYLWRYKVFSPPTGLQICDSAPRTQEQISNVYPGGSENWPEPTFWAWAGSTCLRQRFIVIRPALMLALIPLYHRAECPTRMEHCPY